MVNSPSLYPKPLFRPSHFHSRLSLALIGAFVLLAAALVVTVSASAPSAAELRLRGWVNELNQERLTVSRQQAQQQLENQGEAAVPALLTALRSDNWVLRRNAADMLGYIASPQAISALREALNNDPVPTVRVNAVYALGELSSPTMIADLQRAAVLDPSAPVRQAAADSLARARTRLALSAGVNEQLLSAFALAPNDANVIYAAAGRNLLVTRNAGKTWEALSGALPSQTTALATSPANSNVLYAGLDGLGLYTSTDGGQTWRATNNGLNVPAGARFVVNAIAVDPQNAQRVAVSTGVWLGTSEVTYHALGIFQTTDGGVTWTAVGQVNRAVPLSGLQFKGSQLFALVDNQVLTYPL